MKPFISTKITRANIAAILSILEETPGRIERISSSLSETELQLPLGRNERSLTQDLAHLINCEARSAEAVYLALLLEAPLLPNIHPERHWGKLLGHEQFNFAELRAYFNFRRAVLLRVLRSLNDGQWERVVREEGKKRQESVYWRARTIALHETDHLLDLEGKLHK